MANSIVDTVYPERRLFGFTRCDGTTHFSLRVRALLQAADVVLDVGCGRGQRSDDPCKFRSNLQDFRGDGRTVIGIDVDPAAAANGFIHEFHQIEDPRRWPVADASINLIYCDYVLEHVDDPGQFFSEAHRVLVRGGHLCLRTPNFYGYGTLISWLIPNKHHKKVLAIAKPGFNEADAFPTRYRCNTRGKIRRVSRKFGFDAVAYAIEGEPGYLEFFPLAYRFAAIVHPFLPSFAKSTLLAFARKN